MLTWNRNKRSIVCDLVENQFPNYKRETRAEGLISFKKTLCEEWLLRIRIGENDLLRQTPVRMHNGKLSIATNILYLQVVDLEQNRFISFALEDLVPLKNELSMNVYSPVYDSLEQLLFVVQASLLSYSVVESEFESCLLKGIDKLRHFRNS